MDGSSFLASFKAAAASSTKEMIQFSGSIDSFPIRGDEVFKNMFYWEINNVYLAHVIEKPNLRIPNPQYFFNNIRLMYTLCFLVASVKLKVYKKVVKFSFKKQKILGIRNS